MGAFILVRSKKSARREVVMSGFDNKASSDDPMKGGDVEWRIHFFLTEMIQAKEP